MGCGRSSLRASRSWRTTPRSSRPRRRSRIARRTRIHRGARRTWPRSRGPSRRWSPADPISAMSLRRRLVPYGLLGPGAIWLVLFFVVPMYFMGEMALRSGALEAGGFKFTWEWANFPDALEGRGEQIGRTFFYSATATVLALLIAYPLAYAIAIKVSR